MSNWDTAVQDYTGSWDTPTTAIDNSWNGPQKQDFESSSGAIQKKNARPDKSKVPRSPRESRKFQEPRDSWTQGSKPASKSISSKTSTLPAPKAARKILQRLPKTAEEDGSSWGIPGVGDADLSWNTPVSDNLGSNWDAASAQSVSKTDTSGNDSWNTSKSLTPFSDQSFGTSKKLPVMSKTKSRQTFTVTNGKARENRNRLNGPASNRPSERDKSSRDKRDGSRAGKSAPKGQKKDFAVAAPAERMGIDGMSTTVAKQPVSNNSWDIAPSQPSAQFSASVDDWTSNSMQHISNDSWDKPSLPSTQFGANTTVPSDDWTSKQPTNDNWDKPSLPSTQFGSSTAVSSNDWTSKPIAKSQQADTWTSTPTFEHAELPDFIASAQKPETDKSDTATAVVASTWDAATSSAAQLDNRSTPALTTPGTNWNVSVRSENSSAARQITTAMAAAPVFVPGGLTSKKNDVSKVENKLSVAAAEFVPFGRQKSDTSHPASPDISMSASGWDAEQSIAITDQWSKSVQPVTESWDTGAALANGALWSTAPDPATNTVQSQSFSAGPAGGSWDTGTTSTVRSAPASGTDTTLVQLDEWAPAPEPETATSSTNEWAPVSDLSASTEGAPLAGPTESSFRSQSQASGMTAKAPMARGAERSIRSEQLRITRADNGPKPDCDGSAGRGRRQQSRTEKRGSTKTSKKSQASWDTPNNLGLNTPNECGRDISGAGHDRANFPSWDTVSAPSESTTNANTSSWDTPSSIGWDTPAGPSKDPEWNLPVVESSKASGPQKQPLEKHLKSSAQTQLKRGVGASKNANLSDSKYSNGQKVDRGAFKIGRGGSKFEGPEKERDWSNLRQSNLYKPKSKFGTKNKSKSETRNKNKNRPDDNSWGISFENKDDESSPSRDKPAKAFEEAPSWDKSAIPLEESASWDKPIEQTAGPASTWGTEADPLDSYW
ncbi:hypothetical protein V1512DRAFT_292456 [Lipomyces arxii]|uniref:uncharacterized protein n=1 Tax=Lipomyces arxii TaxID=56418 RepID=UPI0034CDE735